MPESKRRKPNGRPIPPSGATQTKKKDASPTWYVVVMAGLMAVGVILVLLRFIFELDRMVLIGGLVGIAAGFVMTTNYR